MGVNICFVYAIANLINYRTTFWFVASDTQLTPPQRSLSNPGVSDIVKVRLQTTSQYKSALDCATQIFKKEGPAAFYKGTLTPLIGIGACVSAPVPGFQITTQLIPSIGQRAIRRIPSGAPQA